MAAKDGKGDRVRRCRSPTSASRLRPAEDGAGVTVTEVAPDSAAAERGLKAGDVILEVAGTEVHQPVRCARRAEGNGKKRVLMLVKTDDGQRFIALPTAKRLTRVTGTRAIAPKPPLRVSRACPRGGWTLIRFLEVIQPPRPPFHGDGTCKL